MVLEGNGERDCPEISLDYLEGIGQESETMIKEQASHIVVV